jgi:hypothetical protein
MASNKEYHDFLQFLYFEGYAESYAEAEELVESLSDDEIEELNEMRVGRATKRKLERLGDSSGMSDEDRRTRNRLVRQYGPEFFTNPRKPKPSATRSASKPKSQESEEPSKPRYRGIRNVQYNEFDLVADYLFNEGFADTPESAEVMAENISETWMNQILESQEEE